jgi:hypothetical protein
MRNCLKKDKEKPSLSRAQKHIETIKLILSDNQTTNAQKLLFIRKTIGK